MGQIIFGLPEDTAGQLEESNPARLNIINEATSDYYEQLRAAVDEILSTEAGRDLLARATEASSDGNVYIFVDPTITTTSGAARTSLDHNSVIIIQPCDASFEYQGADGEHYTIGLSRIIAHEATHIANGDIQRPAREGSRREAQQEKRAINEANEVAAEADPSNIPRNNDYDDSGRIDPSCSSTDFQPGF